MSDYNKIGKSYAKFTKDIKNKDKQHQVNIQKLT
jgi:hypothetical protein